MIVLIGFGIWRKLTKKESVKIARYEIPVPYKIFFYFYSSFRTVFFTDPDFCGSDPGFWPIRIRNQKESLIRIREEKNLDPKHCFFTERCRYPPVIITAVTVGYYGTFISAQKNCNEQLVNNPTKITCTTTSL